MDCKILIRLWAVIAGGGVNPPTSKNVGAKSARLTMSSTLRDGGILPGQRIASGQQLLRGTVLRHLAARNPRRQCQRQRVGKQQMVIDDYMCGLSEDLDVMAIFQEANLGKDVLFENLPLQKVNKKHPENEAKDSGTLTLKVRFEATPVY